MRSRPRRDPSLVMTAMKSKDFRNGADYLAAPGRETIGAPPFSNGVYVL